MRHVVGERATDKTAASVSQMGRFETCTNWVWLMRRIDEKPDLMNTIAVKICTQVGISSNLEPTNLVFCINLQENTSEKRNLDSSS
jgi:hypothetical protein